MLAQVVGDLQRDRLRAADHPRRLAAAAGVEVALERPRMALVARGGGIEDDEQQRQLAGLGAEDRTGGHRQHLAEAGRHRDLPVDPALEGLTIPGGRLLGGPRRVDGDRLRHLVEGRDDHRKVGQDQRVRRRRPERSGVAVGGPDSVGEVHVLAGVVGGVGADADLAGQRHHVVLGRPHEGGAALGDRLPRRCCGSRRARPRGCGPPARSPTYRLRRSSWPPSARRSRRRPPPHRRCAASLDRRAGAVGRKPPRAPPRRPPRSGFRRRIGAVRCARSSSPAKASQP